MCVCLFFFFSALTDPKRLQEIKTPLMSNRWLIQVIERDGGCESKACGGPTSARGAGARRGWGWHLKVSPSQVLGTFPAAGDLRDCSPISHIHLIKEPGCTFVKLFAEERGVITTKLKGVIFTLPPTWGPVVEYSITCQSQHIRQSPVCQLCPSQLPAKCHQERSSTVKAGIGLLWELLSPWKMSSLTIPVGL